MVQCMVIHTLCKLGQVWMAWSHLTLLFLPDPGGQPTKGFVGWSVGRLVPLLLPQPAGGVWHNQVSWSCFVLLFLMAYGLYLSHTFYGLLLARNPYVHKVT